jgi:hypothetical protein
MANKALKKAVEKRYTALREPGSFTSVSKLRHHHFKKTQLKNIALALEDVDAYTRHKPYKRRFTRHKTQTWSIDRQWQIDLIDMRDGEKENGGMKYILTGIDVFSRYAFAEPVHSKKASDVLTAFKKMTKKRKPEKVQCDKGKEFHNKLFKEYIESEDITMFTSENDDVKCALVERFNGTLQGKLWRCFSYFNNYNWTDILDDVVHSYNHTIHSTLGVPPAKITAENSDALFYRLYEQPRQKNAIVPSLTLKKGSKVRMLAKERAFNRGYEPNWTEEIYTVDSLTPKGYQLKDELGEEIKGTFYQPEVQKVQVRAGRRYDIEKVVKYRGSGKARQGLVKWKGYGDKFNTWEPVKNITKWRSQ